MSPLYIVRVYAGFNPQDPVVEECVFSSEFEAEWAAEVFQEERRGQLVTLEQESQSAEDWEEYHWQEKAERLNDLLDKVPF